MRCCVCPAMSIWPKANTRRRAKRKVRALAASSATVVEAFYAAWRLAAAARHIACCCCVSAARDRIRAGFSCITPVFLWSLGVGVVNFGDTAFVGDWLYLDRYGCRVLLLRRSANIFFCGPMVSPAPHTCPHPPKTRFCIWLAACFAQSLSTDFLLTIVYCACAVPRAC